MNDYYSVTNINQHIKSLLARDFLLSDLTIKGEISGCKYHSSGHIYFTLKDASSQLACVMFAGKRNGLNFPLQDGLEVLVSGSIQVYDRDGKYQLYANTIKKDGIGLLYERIEELKKKLDKEGLFDNSNKKPIPLHPKRIGIVTSKTGAAIHDIITVTKRRNPYVQLVLYPANVQGATAAQTIARGIEVLDKLSFDVIIVGRGGGSIEDLMPFNEEIVARAVYECNTPVISAVGHEIDFTISDYVADLRAATPSVAAELAVFDINDLIRTLKDYEHELTHALSIKVNNYRRNLSNYSLRLQNLSPRRKLEKNKDFLATSNEKIKMLIHKRLDNRKHEFGILIERMNGLSPLNKLKQGYAYVTDEQGLSVNTVENLAVGNNIEVSLIDGVVNANITKINKKSKYIL